VLERLDIIISVMTLDAFDHLVFIDFGLSQFFNEFEFLGKFSNRNLVLEIGEGNSLLNDLNFMISLYVLVREIS